MENLILPFERFRGGPSQDSTFLPLSVHENEQVLYRDHGTPKYDLPGKLVPGIQDR